MKINFYSTAQLNFPLFPNGKSHDFFCTVVIVFFQSEVEETIERIKVQPGVEGYVICNKQGQVLRRFPTMTQETAEQYSEAMMSLSSQARSVVRDLNPKV